MSLEANSLPDQKEVESTPGWGRFPWFAYIDPVSHEARALSLVLGLYVIRPSIEGAVEELEAIATDYLKAEWQPDRIPQEIEREVPRVAQKAHFERFLTVLEGDASTLGKDFNFGAFAVASNGSISRSSASSHAIS